MPEVIDAAIWDRKKWQDKKKEKGNVPKGACLKVNMGDELDKFHNAAKKGPKDGKTAAGNLKKMVATYKTAIKPKYTQLHDDIAKFLDKKIDDYLDKAQKVLDAASHYPSIRAKAAEEMLVVGAEFQRWEKAGSQGKFKPSNAKAAETELTAFLSCLQKMSYATDKIPKAKVLPFDQAVLRVTSGDWTKAAVEALIRMIKDYPNSL